MKSDDIKRLRRIRGWSQQKLAEKMGVGLATVNRWENGKHRPSPMAVEKLRRLMARSVAV